MLSKASTKQKVNGKATHAGTCASSDSGSGPETTLYVAHCDLDALPFKFAAIKALTDAGVPRTTAAGISSNDAQLPGFPASVIPEICRPRRR